MRLLNKYKDLNFFSVVWRKKNVIMKTRSVFWGQDAIDKNILVILTLTTEPIKGSLTGDGLSEWLKLIAGQKSLMSAADVWLNHQIEHTAPTLIKEEFTILMNDLNSKFTFGGKTLNDFIIPEKLAQILLQAKKPVLKQTKITKMNYMYIQHDEY